MTPPTTVVFDLGAVLIDWNPRYLYRTLIDDPDELERFLAEVTTAAWNHEQDRGRPGPTPSRRWSPSTRSTRP